jgi:hypothetical protein
MIKNICIILFIFIRILVNSQNYPKAIIIDDTTYFNNDLELIVTQRNDSTFIARIKINDSTYLLKKYNIYRNKIISIEFTDLKGNREGKSIGFNENKKCFSEYKHGMHLNTFCVLNDSDTIGYTRMLLDSTYETFSNQNGIIEKEYYNKHFVRNGEYLKYELKDNKILKKGNYKVMTSFDIVDEEKYEKLLKKYGYANMYENKYFERSLPIGTWYIRNEKDQLIKIKYDWKGCIKGF